ncbi:hypothetical protein K4F52_010347, partial [Lecanicillium sp. MT-2017a]
DGQVINKLVNVDILKGKADPNDRPSDDPDFLIPGAADGAHGNLRNFILPEQGFMVTTYAPSENTFKSLGEHHRAHLIGKPLPLEKVLELELKIRREGTKTLIIGENSSIRE